MNHYILLTLLNEHPMFNCHGYKSKLEKKIAFWERLYNQANFNTPKRANGENLNHMDIQILFKEKIIGV